MTSTYKAIMSSKFGKENLSLFNLSNHMHWRYSSKDPSIQAIDEPFNPHETYIKATAVVLNL